MISINREKILCIALSLILIISNIVYGQTPVFHEWDYFIYKAVVNTEYYSWKIVEGENTTSISKTCLLTYWFRVDISRIWFYEVILDISLIKYDIGECNLPPNYTREDLEELFNEYKERIMVVKTSMDTTPSLKWIFNNILVKYRESLDIVYDAESIAKILFGTPGYNSEISGNTTKIEKTTTHELMNSTHNVIARYREGVLVSLKYYYTMEWRIWGARKEEITRYTNFTMNSQYSLIDTSVQSLEKYLDETRETRTTNSYPGEKPVGEKTLLLIIFLISILVFTIIAYTMYKKIKLPPVKKKIKKKPEHPPPPPPPPS